MFESAVLGTAWVSEEMLLKVSDMSVQNFDCASAFSSRSCTPEIEQNV